MSPFLSKKNSFKCFKYLWALLIFILGIVIAAHSFPSATYEIAKEKLLFFVSQESGETFIIGLLDTVKGLYNLAIYKLRQVLGYIYEPLVFEWHPIKLMKLAAPYTEKRSFLQILLNPTDWDSVIRQWRLWAPVVIEIPMDLRDPSRTTFFTNLGDLIFQARELRIYAILHEKTFKVPAWAELQIHHISDYLYKAQRVSDIVWETFVLSFVIALFLAIIDFIMTRAEKQMGGQMSRFLRCTYLIAFLVSIWSLNYSILIRRYILKAQKKLCLEIFTNSNMEMSESHKFNVFLLEWLAS